MLSILSVSVLDTHALDDELLLDKDNVLAWVSGVPTFFTYQFDFTGVWSIQFHLILRGGGDLDLDFDKPNVVVDKREWNNGGRLFKGQSYGVIERLVKQQPLTLNG